MNQKKGRRKEGNKKKQKGGRSLLEQGAGEEGWEEVEDILDRIGGHKGPDGAPGAVVGAGARVLAQALAWGGLISGKPFHQVITVQKRNESVIFHLFFFLLDSKRPSTCCSS